MKIYFINRKKYLYFSSSTYRITIHELQPSLNSSPLSLSNFLWSKYCSIINERSVSHEFFDHYLISINSGFEIDMMIEYCYDIQHDLYWLTQIQLVSHSLILLHYVGIPEDDTSNDFWAYIYGQRCHPIGWCKENSKLMLPPPIVTKRAIQKSIINTNNLFNGNDKQLINYQNDSEELQTPPHYLFDKVRFCFIFKKKTFNVLHHFSNSFKSKFIKIFFSLVGKRLIKLEF